MSRLIPKPLSRTRTVLKGWSISKSPNLTFNRKKDRHPPICLVTVLKLYISMFCTRLRQDAKALWYIYFHCQNSQGFCLHIAPVSSQHPRAWQRIVLKSCWGRVGERGNPFACLSQLSRVFGLLCQVMPLLRPYAPELARWDMMMMMMMNAVQDKGRFSDPPTSPSALRIPLLVLCLTTLCFCKISLP